MDKIEKQKTKKKMESVVKSDVFTDEQKVVIVEALSKGVFVIDVSSTFEKVGNAYFIKFGPLYNYVLQFVDGFRFLKITTYDQNHAYVFKKFTITENTTRFKSGGDVYYYDSENIFPYVHYNKDKSNSNYLVSSDKIAMIKSHINKFGINTDLFDFIENTHKVPDEFSERIDKLPTSEDYKSVLLKKAKNYILNEIECCICKEQTVCEIYNIEIRKAPKDKIEKFIQLICTKKNYSYIKLSNSYKIKFFVVGPKGPKSQSRAPYCTFG